MDFRVARSFAPAAAVFRIGLMIAGGLLAAPASAQDAVQPPPLSSSCDVPAAEIATPAPLPHLEADLRIRKKINILAIGSSSTVGLGASSPSQSYPAQFESILEKTFQGLDVVIINRGVSGEVAAATAERMRTLVAMEKPDLVMWQVGTNDALARVPIEDFVTTVRDTVRWLKEHDVDTVLVGLQYTLAASKDEHYTAIRAALRDIAANENVLLVRRYEAMEYLEKWKSAKLVSPDALHLNDLGYRCLAEHVVRAVVVSAFMTKKSPAALPSR